MLCDLRLRVQSSREVIMSRDRQVDLPLLKCRQELRLCPAKLHAYPILVSVSTSTTIMYEFL